MNLLHRARGLLLPLTPLYRAGWALREHSIASRRVAPRRLRFPLISIGNLSTGGAGKTPTTMALARALLQRGWTVDVLSRGYGRTSSGVARVRTDGTPVEFGDEPLLIARDAAVPVYVAASRYQAGRQAEGELSDGSSNHVHLLDDGFQHRQLHRDIDVVLLNREDWEGRLLPAGDLREPLRALHRADAAAIPANDRGLESELRAWGWQKPIWRLVRWMEVPAMDGPVAAFCGIARPEQFFSGLEAAGVNLGTRMAFRDHHPYSEADLRRIEASARAIGANALVTTEKDAIRLQGFRTLLPVKTVRLNVEIEDESLVLEWISARLTDAPGRSEPMRK